MFHCLASRPVQGATTPPSAQAIAQLRRRDGTVNRDSRLLRCCHRSPLGRGPAVPPAVKLKLEIFSFLSSGETLTEKTHVAAVVEVI